MVKERTVEVTAGEAKMGKVKATEETAIDGSNVEGRAGKEISVNGIVMIVRVVKGNTMEERGIEEKYVNGSMITGRVVDGKTMEWRANEGKCVNGSMKVRV